MHNQTIIEQTTDHFLHFLGDDNQDNQQAERKKRIVSFLADAKSEESVVIHDQGDLLFYNGEQQLVESLDGIRGSDNDRICRFDGVQIVEVNPYAYANTVPEYQMKSGSKSGRRGSSSSSSGGMSCNNNNNNNNNNG